MGDGETAMRLLRQAIEIAPAFSDALEAEGEASRYERRRRPRLRRNTSRRCKLRQEGRPGAPDRHFVLRQQGSHTAEIVAYTRVPEVLKKFALPHLARGNAYLADGQPELALADYERTLKLHPKSLDALALKGEALSALGKYAAVDRGPRPGTSPRGRRIADSA